MLAYLHPKTALPCRIVQSKLTREVERRQMVRGLFHIWHIIREARHKVADNTASQPCQRSPTTLASGSPTCVYQ